MVEGLTVKGLNRRVGNFYLKDISFSMEKGYIMGLVGKMGAGKTSLLECLINPDQAGSGSFVAYDGHAGCVMEHMPFLYDATLKENAMLFGRLYEEYSQERFQTWLERVGLGLDKYYGNLSKGEKVKFQFAVAMAHKPSLLILDEPTAGLDAAFRSEFLYMIQEAVEKEMVSVIISTHLTDDLEKVADYIGYMEEGRLFFCENKDELLEECQREKKMEYRPTLMEALLWKSRQVQDKMDMVEYEKNRTQEKSRFQKIEVEKFYELTCQLGKRNWLHYVAYVLLYATWFATVLAVFGASEILYRVVGGMAFATICSFYIGSLMAQKENAMLYELPVRRYFPITKQCYLNCRLKYLLKWSGIVGGMILFHVLLAHILNRL